jgi:hypothetical protein
MSRTPRFALLLLALALAAAPARSQQQVEDTTFVPKVARPAFTDRHPVVMIDAAHLNYFAMDGLYRGFAALLSQDGLRVIPGVQPFSPRLLEACQVLVVADALGAMDPYGAAGRASAFRASECDAVRDWVREGGSLLFVADHAPFASAMDSLAVRFGVDLGKSYTVDTRRVDPETGNIGCILFTRDLGLLGDHPITRGRDRSERIDRVATFTGQSLMGPPGSKGLLVLSPSAADLPFTPDARREATPEARRRADTTSVVKTPGAVTAVGRFQGVAFGFGRGRVVVLGEAAMFASQFVLGVDAQRMGKDRLSIGLNRPDLDNQQFALNVVRWLARGLN